MHSQRILKINQFEDIDLIVRRHLLMDRCWFQICTNPKMGTSEESHESCSISEIILARYEMRVCEDEDLEVKEQLLKIY
jgi:hypothetical protein